MSNTGNPPPSDAYPTGDFYRHLGDRYLFSEKMTAHHMAAQGRAGVIVVPIGQHGQSFTDIASRSGALRLLREVSHFVRRKAKVAIATHFVQDVFSVAVAGFSDGGDALFGVLTNAGGDADADYFYGRALREVYHLDCDPKDTSAYVAAINAWYANASGATGMRNYRFYTAKGWAASLVHRRRDALQHSAV